MFKKCVFVLLAEKQKIVGVLVDLVQSKALCVCCILLCSEYGLCVTVHLF